MPFHASFWLAASAAAPVITLAIVVAIPDAAGMRFRVDRQRGWLEDELRHADVPEPKAGDTTAAEREKVRHQMRSSLLGLERAAQVTRRNVRLCYANLIAQAALLAVSLAALAYNRDVVPPWLAIIVAVGGVALLAWTLLRGTGMRADVERAVRSSPPGEP